MNIQEELMVKMKEAMKAKDTISLTALRALKSAFMLAKTELSVGSEISKEQELKIVQKQVKQRKDSAQVFLEQDRKDLAEPELAEAKVLEQFLPESLSEEEVKAKVLNVIAELGATSMKDMGKVMGVVSGKLAGQADGKLISAIVKQELQ